MSEPGQLKMYLGGMGGTGKSQVIKALISFFEKCNETHHIMILALTGSAASLLNSSTYHSVLGILTSTKSNKTLHNEHTNIAQVKTQLDGVDYIFFVTVHCSSIYLLTTMWGMDSIMAQNPAILIVFWHGLCALPKGI